MVKQQPIFRHCVRVLSVCFCLKAELSDMSTCKQVIGKCLLDAEGEVLHDSGKEQLALFENGKEIMGASKSISSAFPCQINIRSSGKGISICTQVSWMVFYDIVIYWIVDKGSIKLIYCPSEEMVTDMLTKALPVTN
jgi:hypothetical protein